MTQLIPESDLADMRAAQEQAMPSLVQVSKRTGTVGDRGVVSTRKTVVDDSENNPWPCRVGALGFAEERAYGDRIGDRESYILHFAYSKRALLDNGYYVVYSHDKGDTWSASFEVIDVISGQSWQTVSRALIARQE